MKIIISLIIMTCIMYGEAYCKPQQDSLKLKIICYLIEKGELKETQDKDKYLGNIYMAELIKTDKIENKDSSCIFYKVGTFSSHSLTYLMIKKNQEYEMMDLKNIDEVLVYVISLLREKKRSPQEILDSIEVILLLYQKNLKAIPWTD